LYKLDINTDILTGKIQGEFASYLYWTQYECHVAVVLTTAVRLQTTPAVSFRVQRVKISGCIESWRQFVALLLQLQVVVLQSNVVASCYMELWDGNSANILTPVVCLLPVLSVGSRRCWRRSFWSTATSVLSDCLPVFEAGDRQEGKKPSISLIWGSRVCSYEKRHLLGCDSVHSGRCLSSSRSGIESSSSE
jgi:hypothetical protein